MPPVESDTCPYAEIETALIISAHASRQLRTARTLEMEVSQRIFMPRPERNCYTKIPVLLGNCKCLFRKGETLSPNRKPMEKRAYSPLNSRFLGTHLMKSHIHPAISTVRHGFRASRQGISQPDSPQRLRGCETLSGECYGHLLTRFVTFTVPNPVEKSHPAFAQ